MSKSTSTNGASQPQPEQTTVALNAAKLELALVVMLCIIAALLTLRLPLEPLVEVAVLGFIAAVGAVWIILRTRRAVRRLSIEAQGENSNGAP